MKFREKQQNKKQSQQKRNTRDRAYTQKFKKEGEKF